MPSRTSSTASWRATAAALPRKTPAGSRLDRRCESATPSFASSPALRWTASSDDRRTAIQKRPAAARTSTSRSGSTANANSTSTSTANGATWFRATRDRSSMRKSLPATSAASRHMERLRVATGDDDLAIDQRRGTLQLVAGEEDRDAGHRRAPDEGVQDVAPGGVEPGVGLVQEPDAGIADEQGGERGATPLTGGE